MTMVRVQEIVKVFRKGKNAVRALDGISLSMEKGSWLTVTGKSGSGKSTLLYAIGGLLKPASGRVEVEGTDVYGLSTSRRAAWRGRTVGFIFQSFHLFPHLTVIENVLMSGGRFRTLSNEAEALLERMGLSRRRDHLPSELSVGEKQRVATARAVLCRPSLILADEPTGNLDQENGRIVLDDLVKFNREGVGVILVTHKPVAEIRDLPGRMITLENGREK
jgi:putative ABC transport system ATP-binding protein